MEKTGQWRFTPPTHVVAAFIEALHMHELEGGVAARGARYTRNRDVVVEGMRALGFETLLEDRWLSPIICHFLLPRRPKFSFQGFYDAMKARGFIIYPGKLTVADSFRIGCIGRMDEHVMRRIVEAAKEALDEMGVTDAAPPAAAWKNARNSPPEGKEMPIKTPVVANDRTYPAPRTCAIAICLDGCEPEYLDVAIAEGLMPTLKRMRETGTDRTGPFGDPVFTNPNNLSIATGRPPTVHGICGNYLFDPDTGEEVMMNDVRFLRAPTLFSKFYEAGARVAVVTAKDKLRALLGPGLNSTKTGRSAFSSEKSDQATKAENGIDNAALAGRPVPEVYSAELSEFVFAAGVKLLKEWKPDVMYLSTTDYIQHKFAPEERAPRISTRCSTGIWQNLTPSAPPSW